MNSAKRLRLTLAALMGGALVLLVAMLFMHDAGTLSQAAGLSERLDKVDRERLEALVAEKSLEVLRPQSVLFDGRRGEFLAGLQAAADDAALAAWAKAPGATRPDPKPLLAGLAAKRGAAWSGAVLLDAKGKVQAVWPAVGPGSPALLGADLSKDPLFKELSDPNMAPGIPTHTFKKGIAKPAEQPKDKKSAAAAPAPAPALIAAACGIDDGKAGFAGMLLVQAEAPKVLLQGDQRDIDALLTIGPGTAVMAVRGNGDEIWHSSKPAFSENLASISAEYKSLLAALAKAPQGRLSVSSYDGKPGVAVWQRVGSVPEGAAPEAVLSLLSFVPQSAFGAGAGAKIDPPRPFYQRPLVLLLLLLALGLPLGLGWLLLPKALDTFDITARQAGRVEEYAPIPELVLPDEQYDDAARSINRALNTLARRAGQAEDRVRELDSALLRVEDRAGKDATQAAVELSELREKLAGAETGKQASEAKFDAAQKARQEAEAQLGNLKSALETATRNTELKNSENKNLSTQVQDLMRALEEQRKVAEKAQETVTRKDSELVRLAAVNTLNNELKATLTVIKNYISTMLGSQGAISDAQQEFLGVVINKSARLERLIGDLVELSEIGSGIKPLRLENTPFPALVQEALVNARPQAEHKKISLDLAEGAKLSDVAADKEKMGAVLRTLLSQAIKVTSRNEKIGLLLSERESTVELRVSDPGMSLPPDRAAKVFNQFHGVDSQSGPEFIGTGLRFPILKSVVEAHGGKIWIESQVGRGKTFVIALPKAGAARLPEGTPPPMAAAPIAPPALPGLPPLGPPPAVAPLAPPKPAGLPTLPPIGSLPPPPPAPPKPAGPPPVVHKPAPLDESLAAPWKRKDDAPKDELLDDDLPTLPPPKPLSTAPTLPSLPPVAAPAVSLPPLDKPALKTDAKPSEEDKADFDKVFGAMPAQAAEGKGAPPKVELKTAAKPDDKDMAQFAALFGGGAAPVPPPGLGTPPPPPGAADFDKIFGGPPAGAPPPPPGLGTPPPPPAAADFDKIFGGGAPPPPPGLGTPPPPPKAITPTDLDALFGAPPSAGSGQAPAPAPPPPAGLPTPPPPPPGLGTPPPPPPSGGLNNMDDLNKMLGN